MTTKGTRETTKRATDGRQARWSKHNEERRRRIIEAAITVVEQTDPGTEVKVSAIAAEAGVGRTVIYRHFEDRADLDRAVRETIIERLWDELLPQVTLDGTVPQIIERIVGTYVRWAVAHPNLHRMADHDVDAHGDGPLERAMEEIADTVAMVINTALLGLEAKLTEEQAEAMDPLVFGVVGAVFSAVRRWVSRDQPQPSAEALIAQVSRSVWFLIAGQAEDFGVTLAPDVPLEELLAAPSGSRAPTA